MCTPEECASLKTRIEALDSEIDNVVLGKRTKKVAYGARSIETSDVSLADLRRRKAELEQRYRDCACRPTLTTAEEPRRRAIRTVFR